MNDELIDHRIGVCETRLNDHAKRLDKVEIEQGETNVKIENLCKSIASQTKALWWLITTLGCSLVAFFFYAIQQKLF